jgi:hypothetical protein
MKIKSLLLLAACAFAMPAIAADGDLDPSTNVKFEQRNNVEPGQIVYINFILENPNMEYSTAQMDLDYPEGWEAVKFSQKDAGIGTKPAKAYCQMIPEGRLDEIWDDDGNGHGAFTIVGNVPDDASFRFAYYDAEAEGKKVACGDDAIAVIAIQIPEGATVGDNTITVREVWLATGLPDGEGDGGIDDFTFTIKVDPVGVKDVNANKAVAGVKYYNIAGVESDKPFDGVNVVVTTYTDGTKAASKVIK